MFQPGFTRYSAQNSATAQPPMDPCTHANHKHRLDDSPGARCLQPGHRDQQPLPTPAPGPAQRAAQRAGRIRRLCRGPAQSRRGSSGAGRDLSVVCLQALPNSDERLALRRSLRNTGKDILALDFDQLEAFAGNLLEAHDRDSQPLRMMSASAWNTTRSRWRQCPLHVRANAPARPSFQ
ncbi:hypothetical protein SAMN04490179_3060 [Pseudomonas antarctica]|uniref:Uncharacterized protein n=1 Tax=Pseudomonas antarctica TaxID=219572 RepID=A0A1G9ZEM5_9PSED|nr:hypothetical protein PSAN_36280 [Pseudomonas antarctica]SDN19852.1 hypothetical protein SAMN04490179_3060 [Pseudomonas antarctica]